MMETERKRMPYQDLALEVTKAALGKRFPVKEDARLRNQNLKPGNSQPPQNKPQPQRPPTPDQPSQKKTPSHRAEDIKNRARAALTADHLRANLGEAGEITSLTASAQLFARIITRGDELGSGIYVLEKGGEGWQEWFNLPWETWEAEIRSWAQGGNITAKEIVENIHALGITENTILRDIMMKAFVSFGPCRRISTFGSLFSLAKDLVENKLAQRIDNPKQIPEGGVIIPRGRDVYLYLPVKGGRVSLMGWGLFKEAETRTKEYEAKVQKYKEGQRAKIEALIKAKTTPGLTPIKISAGEEGHLFLFLSRNQGVLIEARNQNGQMMARVTEGVGYVLLPAEWVRWEPEREYVPLRGAKWPLEEIPQALKTWEEKIRQEENISKTLRTQAEARAKEEQEKYRKILAPVTSIATFPIPFEGQGLTQLLKGRVGVVATYNWNFQWSEATGLFAIALERRENEEFLRLAKVVTYYKFPFSKLCGKRLPRLVIEEKDGSPATVRLAQLPKIKGEIYQALKMVEKTIQMRLNAEYRNRSGEPAPEEKNNRTG